MRLEAPRSWGAEPDLDLEAYGGADIVLYRVPEPLEFLRQQRNLHRIQVAGRPHANEGLANALGYVWDSWYKKSRLAWQRLFSAEARSKAVQEVPELKQAPAHSYRTEFRQPPPFEFMEGLQRVAAFRYPLLDAKPIAPPADVRLQGSSSEFLSPRSGDIQIPLGKLAPGLYLVEAYIGRHRATTVVFVSDTVAVTKLSGHQLLVWTAQRDSGAAVAGAKLLVSDGLGVLDSGQTDGRGLWVGERQSPERSYVMGQDAAGGVFVSENFYYDSEIYATKLYAFTDRPLYRPGDRVRVKLMGRTFEDARRSKPLVAGDLTLTVLDPSGTPVTAVNMQVAPDAGGDTEFELPGDAIPGGYSLRMSYQGALYGAAFRVAQYAKPHFEIDIVADQRHYQTGEAVKGRVRLAYPGGKPVAGAGIELSLRSQALSLSGDASPSLDPSRPSGLFPHKLAETKLTSDEGGEARFELPAAPEPSRYILTVRAQDQGSYRVSATQEYVIQPASQAYALVAPRQFSAPAERVGFRLRPLNQAAGQAVRWEALRLEDQTRQGGDLQGDGFELAFERAGSYTLRVLGADGASLGTASHWVTGAELKSPPGAVQILLDKEEYRPGDTAQVVINFPVPVTDALLTLERDRVEQFGLLTQPGAWLRLTREDDQRWRAEIPLKDAQAPNMTLSVAYVRGGEYIIQNKGLRVLIPRIQVSFAPDKPSYAPGERVQVEVSTRLDGQPRSAHVTVGVVDEAVYVLQPEIAPDIGDFFYHLRRNQVRTGSSLNFHSYDKALPAEESAPTPAQANRLLKMLERPRRDAIDTAFWAPDLVTGPDGKARFSFTMPDSLTRWRITGRAMSEAGGVGQGLAYLTSAKDFYLKWTGPSQFRQGDQPLVSLVAFNEGKDSWPATLVASGPGLDLRQDLELRPGANYLRFPLRTDAAGTVSTRLEVAGQIQDRLDSPFDAQPEGWLNQESLTLDLGQARTPVSLPAGAIHPRLTLAGSSGEHFLRIADSLVDYPYGCVEQSASRLLPLTQVYRHLQVLDPGAKSAVRLRDRIAHHRLRLARMAGPEARFGWWGNQTENDPFLTAYAYFADYQALKALGIQPRPGHWDKLLEVYRDSADALPLLHRVLTLWLARDMGLPVKTLVDGAIDQAIGAQAEADQEPPAADASLVLEAGDAGPGQDLALVLLRNLAQGSAGHAGAKALATLAEAARKRLEQQASPLAQAGLFATRPTRGGASDPAGRILARVGPQTPTIDRALTLLLVERGLTELEPVGDLQPGSGWQRQAGAAGGAVWHWQGPGAPLIDLGAAPAKPRPVRLTYERFGPGAPTLPLTLERRLYHLRPASAEEIAAAAAAHQADAELSAELADQVDSEEPSSFQTLFMASRLPEPWQVQIGELYLDELRLVPPEGSAHSFGVVDVPLPAGADVETTTWGIGVAGLSDETDLPEAPSELAEARFAPGQLYYSVPLELLEAPTLVRHLLRFGQAGDLTLPPARYLRMYQPSDQALESGGLVRQIQVH